MYLYCVHILHICTYFTGLNGLEELETLDSNFQEFENSLFAESSLTFERSVQTKEVNEKLDVTIQRFLIRLSPFCLLKPAHKALEWLIHRYVHCNFESRKFQHKIFYNLYHEAIWQCVLVNYIRYVFNWCLQVKTLVNVVTFIHTVHNIATCTSDVFKLQLNTL